MQRPYSNSTWPIWVACLFFVLLGWLSMSAASVAAETAPVTEVPLVVGNRTIHVFRASLGEFSAAERAAAARQRIVQGFTGAGEGWTSVKTTDQGILVQLDGKPMFTVVRGDAREALGETTDDLANAASRVLQKTWAEAQERRDPRTTLRAVTKVALALAALFAALYGIVRAVRALRGWLTARLEQRLDAASRRHFGAKLAAYLPVAASHSCLVLAWLLSLFCVFVFLTYSLAQFVATRPVSEDLTHSLGELVQGILGAAGAALPGMFISVVIFLLAWVVTQVSTQMFQHVESSPVRLGMLDAHTAPATRRITNASIWLFAVAMAYPYLPGSHTEAFKGLTVILGLMASIGASGLVGQIASGVMLVYTRAVCVGEYVRVNGCEGTVTELGLFVTRLRTGLGEEIALPNALVLANVIHNYSRIAHGRGFVLDASVSIGYDVPWRQIHAMLLDAAKQIPEIKTDPAPYVVQVSLDDFYVVYRLVVQVDSARPATRARVASDLHAAIQDVFNQHGVQIMSPHYYSDPNQPKTVPQAQWYAPPAVKPATDTARPA